ncbi:MAG: hypothetical protein WKG07_44845 [Hymenobacter sp.]
MLITIYPSGRATLAGSLHKLRHGWAQRRRLSGVGRGGYDRRTGLFVRIPTGRSRIAPRWSLAECAATGGGHYAAAPGFLVKTLPFNLNYFGNKGYHLEAVACQYYLKLYDKQRHLVSGRHLEPGPLLRVELKTGRTCGMAGPGEREYAGRPDQTSPGWQTLGGLLADRLAQLFVCGRGGAGAPAEGRATLAARG